MRIKEHPAVVNHVINCSRLQMSIKNPAKDMTVPTPEMMNPQKKNLVSSSYHFMVIWLKADERVQTNTAYKGFNFFDTLSAR